MLKNDQLLDCIHSRALPQQDILLLIMSVNAEKAKKIQEIKASGRNAGLPEILQWNVSSILKRSRGKAINVKEGWILTSKGKACVESMDVFPKIKAPRIVNVATELRAITNKIKSQDTKVFLEEAICCFEAGYYRSSVVLSWVGAIDLLQEYVVNNCLTSFNAEALRIDSKWKSAKTKDDLGRMKESDFLDLLATPLIGLIGKNVKEELKNNCLQLRNACGHPNSLKVGVNRIAAHMEFLMQNIFSKY